MNTYARWWNKANPGANVFMLSFELQETEDGFVLSGGQLKGPLHYPDRESAERLVGFLSQQEGSELRICRENGDLTSIQRREPAMPFEKGSLGSGLRGESDLGN